MIPEIHGKVLEWSRQANVPVRERVGPSALVAQIPGAGAEFEILNPGECDTGSCLSRTIVEIEVVIAVCNRQEVAVAV